MKSNMHPVYQSITAHCQCGNTFETRFADLTGRLDNFAEKIQAYTLRTGTLEGNFKEHVDVAFSIVDAEYRKLTDFIKDKEHDAKQGETPVGATTSAARDALLQSRIEVL